MSFAQSFKSFVGPSPMAATRDLGDWLTHLPQRELTHLSSTIARCRVGEGNRSEEDDLLTLTQMHHVLKRGVAIQCDDVQGWLEAFADLHRQTQQQNSRRLGIDSDITEALFHN